MADAGVFFDALLAFDRKYAALQRDMDGVMTRNASLREGIAGFHMGGLELMRQFFSEHKRRGTIRPDIDDDDLTIICSALAHGLTGNVGSGLDPADAKRLWLLGLVRLLNLNLRAGK